MTDRLYYPPDHTEEVLRKATSGASTIKDLADLLGYTPKTTSNKAHDPAVLGLIERDDYQLSVSEDARRVVQLEDTTPLKNAFTELPGVQEVLDRIEKESIDVEEVGRLISFNTNSNAAAESTFKNYGRVYAEWIDYLGLGSYSNGVVAAGSIENTPEKEGPLDNPRGANSPNVRPEKVFEILPLLAQVESREELRERAEYSEGEVSKIVSTCYGLGIAESARNSPELTNRGKELQQGSVGNRKRMLREALLELPLVQAYCERAPEDEFKNQEVMEQVSEDYLKGWSEVTIQTRAKRLYSWLLFTELFEEQSRGYLEPTENIEADELAAP